MKLKLCPKCKRPYMASEEFCPRCPQIEWNQENWMNFGCLIATILPAFIMVLFWILFFFGLFFR